MCDHSDKAFVSKIRTPSEECVEPVLEELFSTFGAPETYKTDNGSPFQSYRFKEFAAKWGFSHRKVTPEWPRANGKAESFIKKLGKVLKTAKVSGMDEQVALREFLRRYNETPHSTTGVAPNHLFLGFSRSSGIPSMLPETPEQREKWRKMAMENDARAKKRMELEYNRRMRTKEPTINVGDQVLIKLKRHRKNTSAWDSEPYTVTEVNGSMVTASRHDRTTTRNSSCFKLYRHIEFDLPEKEPVQSNSERREEAALTEQATQPSQETESHSTQKVPGTENGSPSAKQAASTQQTAEEQATAPAPVPSAPKPTKSKQQAKEEIRAAKLALNPPTRSSDRLKAKKEQPT